MIYPEDDQTRMGTDHYLISYPFTINSLKVRSPTLPLHFDKKYLPSMPCTQLEDICEKELLGLSECLLLYNVNEKEREKMCSLQASRFESCRRRRDLRIIGAIYKWETQHVRQLDKENRALYLRGLGFKLDRLDGDLKRQPSTVAGLSRIGDFQSEIKELKWRINYLKPIKIELE